MECYNIICLKLSLILVLTTPSILSEPDLYRVLGVHKSASQKEIKQSYKRLAREFHPDKTDDPEATDKFTKINEAYETLGNPEKRQQYDDFGYTAASERQPSQHRGGFNGFSPFDGFDGFGNNGGYKFNFGGGGSGGGESVIDKHIITMREYQRTILPNSNRKPCIMYSYTDFCFNCMRIEGIIEKFFQELKSVGICAAAINAQRSGDLASLLRVKHVPSISGVVGERVTYFNGPVNTQNLREFTRKMFPSNFVTAVSDSNLHSFLDGWSDNRVRAIFFSQKEQFTARFLAPAYYYRENVMFGYVNTMSVSARSIMEKYGLNKHRETLLMFNEQTDSPVATISMQQLPRSTLDEVIEANKYLMLPRISSQTYFDGLCPEEFKIKNRKLCVVLFTRKSPDHDPHRDNFRKYSQRSPLSSNARVRFAYVYEDLQQEFLQALTKGRQGQSSGADLMVAIVWRMEKQQMKYEWLESRWNADREREKLCARALEDRLNVLLSTDSVMPYRASIPTFYNEHGYGLLRRIGLKLLSWCDRMWSYVSGHDGATWITLTLSVLFVAGIGYFMHSLATLEEEQVQGTAQPATRPRPQSRMTDEKTMKVFELEYKTYAELVTEADTGLTFVLLVDKDTKPKLLKNFAKVVYNYTRYSALTFSYLQLEYHLGWYKSLLEESTDNDKIDNINMKNCVGTILALNGYRKYFYMFSAKRARKFIRERNNVSEALGLHDLDETSDHEGDESVRDFFLLDEILDGLDIWMDKIFDGSIRRIRITNWPAMEQ